MGSQRIFTNRLVLGGICLPLAGLVWICWSHEAKSSNPNTLPVATIVGGPVEALEISDSLTYPARVIPKINTSILAESDGIVSRIPAQLGQATQAGRELMVLSHTDPIYQYSPMKVLSPINGVVSSIDVSEGSQVMKGQKLATVMDPGKLRITIEVPAEDRLSLRRGLHAEFRVGESSGAVLVTLTGLSPFVDPVTGTSSCEFEFGPSGAGIAPGMVGRIFVRIHPRKAIEVPEYAVIYRNQAPFLRVFEAGKIRLASVRLGKKQGGKIEILSGIRDKEFVVERSSRFVAEGEHVELDPDTAARGIAASAQAPGNT